MKTATSDSNVAKAAPIYEYFGIKTKFRMIFEIAQKAIAIAYSLSFPQAIIGLPKNTFRLTTITFIANIDKGKAAAK